VVTYRFTREQLVKALDGAIEMFMEFRDQHGHIEETARFLAVDEILDGLDADRELVAHDPNEKLRLQLPIVEQADASAESFEANSNVIQGG
jgi:hypothetical protein